MRGALETIADLVSGGGQRRPSVAVVPAQVPAHGGYPRGPGGEVRARHGEQDARGSPWRPT